MQAVLTLPAPATLPAPLAPPATLFQEKKPAPTLATAAPLILFGRDERGRPHAACFVGNEEAAVEHAADLMGLYFVAAETELLRDLAAKLPSGRLFASGRGFVPFVKAELYNRLFAATGTPDTPRPVRATSKPTEGGASAGGGSGSGPDGAGAGGPAGKGPVPKHPTNWDEIGIGSHVLACQAPMEGWYEAVVLYTRSDKTGFTLRWRDWPDEPEIVRARKDLGLLPVNSREGMA